MSLFGDYNPFDSPPTKDLDVWACDRVVISCLPDRSKFIITAMDADETCSLEEVRTLYNWLNKKLHGEAND